MVREFTKEHRRKLSEAGKKRKYKLINCETCGKELEKKSYNQIYCKDCYKIYRRNYQNVKQNKFYYLEHDKNKEQHRLNTNKWRKNNRLKVLKALGNKCVKCGFSDWRALQIDHVNSDGAWERRIQKTNPSVFYRKVTEEKDSGKYQLLCANCNWIKRYEKKELTKNRITNSGLAKK